MRLLRLISEAASSRYTGNAVRNAPAHQLGKVGLGGNSCKVPKGEYQYAMALIVARAVLISEGGCRRHQPDRLSISRASFTIKRRRHRLYKRIVHMRLPRHSPQQIKTCFVRNVLSNKWSRK